jgi:hypothetical protein
VSARGRRTTANPPRGPREAPAPHAPRAAHAIDDHRDDAATAIYHAGTHAPAQSGSIRVISMKPPGDAGGVPGGGAADPALAAPVPAIQRPQLRAISEVSSPGGAPAHLGYLAPPRDPLEVRARRVRDLVIWGAVSVIVASAVALVIWFVAR